MNGERLAVEPYDGPALVYGMWRGAGYVVLGAEWAAKAAEEIEAIIGAKTWGQAKVASDAATHVSGPLDDDLEDRDLAPDDPVIQDDIPGWADGDWPPMPCLYTEYFLPEDWPIGEEYSTTLNGDGFLIPPEDEQRLLQIAAQSGAPIARDDALVHRLDPDW